MYPFPSDHPVVVAEPWAAVVRYGVLTFFLPTLVVLSVRQKPTTNPFVFRTWLTTVLLACLLVVFGALISSHNIKVLMLGTGCLLCALRGLAISRRDLSRATASTQLWKSFEQLVVIGVLFVAWVVWLAPPLEQPREKARRTQCKINLKKIGLALHEYYELNGRLPEPSATDGPAVCWRVDLLSHLNRMDLFEQYNRTLTWTSTENGPLALIAVSEFLCPARPVSLNEHSEVLTSYIVPMGHGTLLQATKNRHEEIPRLLTGGANTVLAVESCGSQIVWTNPHDPEANTISMGVNLPGAIAGQSDGLSSSFHAGGANFLFADGSIRFVSQDTSSDVIRELVRVP